jgi:hypothetical protein
MNGKRMNEQINRFYDFLKLLVFEPEAEEVVLWTS